MSRGLGDVYKRQLVDNAYFADSKKDDAAGDFPADDQFAGYGAYQGSVPGGGDDFAPDF